MKSFWLLFLTLIALTANAARFKEVADVFNKRNRILKPPPKSLRAEPGRVALKDTPVPAPAPVSPAAAPAAPAPAAVPATAKPNAPLIVPADGSQKPQPLDEIEDPGLQKQTDNLDTLPVVPLGADWKKAKREEWRQAREDYVHEREAARSERLESLAFKGERVIGVGFLGGGHYGVFGAELDLGLKENWSTGLGVGTGLTYHTWAAHVRHYLRTSPKFNLFLQIGYANWYLRESKGEVEVFPGYLAERFMSDKKGNLLQDKHAHLIYPAIGMLFQHKSGLATVVMAHYLISAMNSTGALYGGAGIYYYF